MVKIDKKTLPVPDILERRGKSETVELTKAFEGGSRSFKFVKKIYGDGSVKTALAQAQHYKCCFCEAKFHHNSYGDVEHFRPKAGWISKAGEKLTRPGYYWLVYDYSNLFYSCSICNRSFKKNFFPLVNEAKRAMSHHYSTSEEEPLILDPSKEDPSLHISFNREVPVPLSEAGAETIKRIGIDRKSLNDDRLWYYDLLSFTAKMARAGDAEALEMIRRAALPTERYSLMVRCNFRDLLD